MINGTQETILKFLISHVNEPPTIRFLARQLKKPYALIYRNVTNLLELNIIQTKRVPPASLISINKSVNKDIIIHIETLIKSDFLNKNPWAKVMLEDLFSYTNKRFFILIIFGSYAKNKQTVNSDLDILIIVPKKEDILELENSIRKTYTRVKKSLILATVEDFKEMIRNTEEFNVGNEAKKHHIIMYGIEQYYGLTQ